MEPAQDRSTSRHEASVHVIPKHSVTGLPVVSLPPHLFASRADRLPDEADPSKTYSTRVTRCNPVEIYVLGGHKHRECRCEHAEALRKRMVSMGYSAERGFIAWTFNASLQLKDCIIGQHRIGAIAKQHKLVEDGKEDSSTTMQFESLETIEYYNPQGGDIFLSDLVILPANANYHSSCVAKFNTADKLRTVVSFLKLNPGLVSKKKVSFNTSFPHEKVVLSGMAPRSLRSYVAVALSLLDNAHSHQVFQRFFNESEESPKATAPGGTAPSVICNPALITATKSAQLLSLIFLNEHHRNRIGAEGTVYAPKGVEESTASGFFKMVSAAADIVEAIAHERNMSAYEVFESHEGNYQGGRQMNAAEFIACLLSSWTPMVSKKLDTWFADMLSKIVERLVSAFPQKALDVPDQPKPNQSSHLTCQSGTQGSGTESEGDVKIGQDDACSTKKKNDDTTCAQGIAMAGGESAQNLWIFLLFPIL